MSLVIREEEIVGWTMLIRTNKVDKAWKKEVEWSTLTHILHQGLDLTNMVKVEIKLSAMETCLRVQINSWLRDDIITHTESPWAGPLVPMAKMDGSTKWGGT